MDHSAVSVVEITSTGRWRYVPISVLMLPLSLTLSRISCKNFPVTRLGTVLLAALKLHPAAMTKVTRTEAGTLDLGHDNRLVHPLHGSAIVQNETTAAEMAGGLFPHGNNLVVETRMEDMELLDRHQLRQRHGNNNLPLDKPTATTAPILAMTLRLVMAHHHHLPLLRASAPSCNSTAQRQQQQMLPHHRHQTLKLRRLPPQMIMLLRRRQEWATICLPHRQRDWLSSQVRLSHLADRLRSCYKRETHHSRQLYSSRIAYE
jgi:hypothetical protein